MRTLMKPVRSTLWMGIVLALGFTPFTAGLRWMFPDPVALRLSLTLCLLVYSLLLVRWSGSRAHSAMLPVLGLGVLALYLPTTGTFVVLAVLSLGWIRSGVCFNRRWPWALGIEVLLGGGGAMFVAVFAPQTGLTWSLGVWMFCLVQTLFFILPRNIRATQRLQADRFERARQAAEHIIRQGYQA